MQLWRVVQKRQVELIEFFVKVFHLVFLGKWHEVAEEIVKKDEVFLITLYWEEKRVGHESFCQSLKIFKMKLRLNYCNINRIKLSFMQLLTICIWLLSMSTAFSAYIFKKLWRENVWKKCKDNCTVKIRNKTEK